MSVSYYTEGREKGFDQYWATFYSDVKRATEPEEIEKLLGDFLSRNNCPKELIELARERTKEISASKANPLSPASIIGRHMAILGSTGQGKTNTTARVCEVMLEAVIPLTILDTDGEYLSLRDSFDNIIIAGDGEGADLPFTEDNAGTIARYSFNKNLSVILDLANRTPAEISQLLITYFTELWSVSVSNLNEETPRPYVIIVEEAHEYVPQRRSTDLKELLRRFALRGRRRGFTLTVVSQSPADVDKTFLKQSSLVILHRVHHNLDKEAYVKLMPCHRKEGLETIGLLDVGQAIVLNNHKMQVLKVKPRHTAKRRSGSAYREPELLKQLKRELSNKE